MFTILLLISAAAARRKHLEPCWGDVLVTHETLAKIRECTEFKGNLTLDGAQTPKQVSMSSLRQLTGNLVFKNYPGRFDSYTQVTGALKMIGQEAYSYFNLYGVKKVGSLRIENSSASFNFDGVQVSDNIEIVNSSTASVTKLGAEQLKKLVVKDCPRLRQLAINIGKVADVEIANTALQTFPFLASVPVQNNLTVSGYRFSELLIEASEIRGHVRFENSPVLRHVYFMSVDSLKADPVDVNNPELKFVQFVNNLTILQKQP